MKSWKLQGKMFILSAVFVLLLSLQEAGAMRISSPEFENNGFIPKKFTCDGQDANPRLNIEDMPAGYKLVSLVALGYPKSKDSFHIARKRGLEELIHWEKF